VFSCILGKAMVYTCGIFHEVPNFASDYGGDHAASANDGQLEQAQFNKMNMLCDKVPFGPF
jgi:cyclopropane fatty-acyl-phospholipid synthase-like methyltransferase